jgi:hypothetical protein
MTRLSVQDILLSKKITKKIEKCFLVFEAENFLPLEIYNELDSTFPPVSLLESATPIINERKEGDEVESFSLYIDNQLNQRNIYPDSHNDVQILWLSFLKKNPLWHNFINLMHDKQFIDDALKLFNDEIKSRSIKYFFRKNKYKERVSNIVVETAFSARGNNSNIPPHTDAGGKILSLLLYFPEEGWSENNKGQTLFFASKNGRKGGNRKWRKLGKINTSVNTSLLRKSFYDGFSVFKKSKYIPNMLAGFVKNDYSWHSLNDVHCEKGSYRKVFMINIKAK